MTRSVTHAAEPTGVHPAKPHPIQASPSHRTPNLMRNNNFDIVRLVLATIVVFVHSSALSLNSSLDILPRILSAHVAVEGFFAISGFLIFASYDRCKSIGEYFSNRAFRILPGYWLSTIFCL